MRKRRKKPKKPGQPRQPQARLEAGIRASLRAYRVEENKLRELERIASRHPDRAAPILVRFAQTEEESARRDLRRYGLEVAHLRGPDETRLVQPECAPRSPRDRLIYWTTLIEHARWEACLVGMLQAAAHADQAGKDPDAAVCATFLKALRLARDLPVLISSPEEQDPLTREMITALLAGRVAASTSISLSTRLKNAVSTEVGSPFEKLLRELPGAVLMEWANFRGDDPAGGPHVSFVNRVLDRVASEGREEVGLDRPSDLTSSPFDLLAEDGPNELDEFAAREDLHALMEAAGLTRREQEVMELTYLRHTQPEIADMLGIGIGAVKTLQFRARERLREAVAR